MPQTKNAGVTLSDVTYVGRQSVKFGAIIIVAMIVGRMMFTSFVAYWKATHPKPPPPPSVGFGKLPPLEFPRVTADDKPASYVLETPTGTLPRFGDRAKVFFIPKSSPNLLADQRAKSIAAQYGYVFEPRILNSRTYRWTKSQPIESTFELDIESLTFQLTSEYLSRPELIKKGRVPTEDQAVQQVKRFLSQAGAASRDIATASGKVTYLKSLGGKLEKAVSESDAEFLQVDLNRAPIDGRYRMYTTEGRKGIVHAILTGGLNSDNAIVEIYSYYRPVEYNQIHTYPLRSTQTAWNLLKAGEGYIASKGKSDTATIRDVYMGYYDSFEEQRYLQPIYVFEGDDGFLGYVPALDSAYIQSDSK